MWERAARLTVCPVDVWFLEGVCVELGSPFLDSLLAFSLLAIWFVRTRLFREMEGLGTTHSVFYIMWLLVDPT